MSARFKTVRYREPANESPRSGRSPKTVARSFRCTSPSFKQQLLEGSSPITPVSPRSLAVELDRLDGLRPSTRWHAPKECNPVESETRHRLTIRRPTKAPSRVVLRGLRSSRASSRTEDRSPISPRQKSPDSVRSRMSFRTPATDAGTSLSERNTSKFKRHTMTMGNKTTERSTFLDYSKFKDGSRSTRPRSTRVDYRPRPSVIEIEKPEYEHLETRIRQDLERKQSCESPDTPTRLDPSIIEYGARSPKKDEHEPPKHNQFKYGMGTLTRVRETVMKRRDALKKAESMSPLELPASATSTNFVEFSPISNVSKTVDSNHTEVDGSGPSITRNHSPVNCTPSRASRPSSIGEDKAPRSTSKLNPLAREFTTMKYQPPAKRLEAHEAAKKLAERPLNVPKQRQSQSKSQASQEEDGSAAPQVKTEPKPISNDRPQLKIQIPMGNTSTPVCVGGGTTEAQPQVVPGAATMTDQSSPTYTYDPTEATPTFNGPNMMPAMPSYHQQQLFPEPMAISPNMYNAPFQNPFMGSMPIPPPVFIGPVSMPSALQVAYHEGRLPIYMNHALPPQQQQQQPMPSWPQYDYGLSPKTVVPPPGFQNVSPNIMMPSPAFANPNLNMNLNPNHSARIANAMGAQLATPLLERFVQRFPNTGKAHDGPPAGQARAPPPPPHINVKAMHPAKAGAVPKTAQGREAALIQQRLEFLLMQRKEKKAFEALQDQISDLEACGVGY